MLYHAKKPDVYLVNLKIQTMKKYIIHILILITLVANVKGQADSNAVKQAPRIVEVSIIPNYCFDLLQDFDAEMMLYDEINQYRVNNGKELYGTSVKMVRYACRWSYYMYMHHKDSTNNSFKHSSQGPDSLIFPQDLAFENIGLVYFDHKPTPAEIVDKVMYSAESPTGWAYAEQDKQNLLRDDINYMGVGIYRFKEGNKHGAYVVAVFSPLKYFRDK